MLKRCCFATAFSLVTTMVVLTCGNNGLPLERDPSVPIVGLSTLNGMFWATCSMLVSFVWLKTFIMVALISTRWERWVVYLSPFFSLWGLGVKAALFFASRRYHAIYWPIDSVLLFHLNIFLSMLMRSSGSVVPRRQAEPAPVNGGGSWPRRRVTQKLRAVFEWLW